MLIEGLLQEYKFEDNKHSLLIYIDFLRDCLQFTTLDKSNLTPLIDVNENEQNIIKLMNRIIRCKIKIKCRIVKKTYNNQIKTFYNIINLYK